MSWKKWSVQSTRKLQRLAYRGHRASLERLLELLLEQQVCCICFEPMSLSEKLSIRVNEVTGKRAVCHLACMTRWKSNCKHGYLQTRNETDLDKDLFD